MIELYSPANAIELAFNKIRMILEVLLFGWFIPGNSKQETMKE
ncbi:MAG: hypothetical protein Q8P28_07305 [Deltaproteobacteria bacterium]|nr:hypothetical protein [Deltaproteobacteria bacterium]